MKDKYIYKPFNTVFFAAIIIYSLFLSSVISVLKTQPLSTRKTFVFVFYIISLFVFYFYKLAISKDEYYWRLCGFTEFNWFQELPLNVCNIVLILMPLAIVLKSRAMFSVAFFSSLILSPMALVMPVQGFSGYSIFTPRVFGYVFSHFMSISAGFLVLSLDIFRPAVSDLPLLFILTVVLDFGIYLVNKWMRKTGINDKANYFYNVDTEGIRAFELCYKLIPHEFWYSVPVMIVFAAASTALTLLLR